MRLFGLTIGRTRKAASSLSPVGDRGWFTLFESNSGNWQKSITVDRTTVLSHHAVFACMTLIASDIAKLRVKLMSEDKDGIWTEVENPAFSPLLRKPNGFQTRNQFWESWMLSKLSRGNTYSLKERDNRGVVVALYILDPCSVTPLVAPDGSVFYQLKTDNISGLETDVLVPAREIIHDRFNCLFHPLVGLSPIYACGVAAMQGLAIQNNQTNFFNNKSIPGGVLTAPGHIADDTAARLKTSWEKNYGGENIGRVAVLGDGLKFETMVMSAVDSQLIEQLKWTAETCCSVFHIPPYKVGVGALPTNSNVQALNVEYYTQCLQAPIEAIEECLDQGLGIGYGSVRNSNGVRLGTEFDIDNLLRMDSVSLMDMLDKGRNTFTPNEARRYVNLPPVDGGDSVYRQQQDFSLEALAKRDAQDDPFKSSSASTPAPQPEPKQLPPPAKHIDLSRVKTLFQRKAA